MTEKPALVSINLNVSTYFPDSQQTSVREDSRTPIKGGRNTFYLVLLQQGKELSSTPPAAKTAKSCGRVRG